MHDAPPRHDSGDHGTSARKIAALTSPDRTFRERVRATSQLVAGILHEFNSPLGALRSSIDTARVGLEKLKASLETDPKRARQIVGQLDDLLRIARSATDRIVDSIETLSHFARVDRADIDDVELGRIIDTALRLSGVLRSQRIAVERDFDPHARLRCRVREVEHVLYHVIRNASEALDGRRDAKLALRACRDGNYVTFIVEDNGPGIDTVLLPTLFEPTLNTKGPSVGLGLSLPTCRYIVQQHGGSLDGENVPGGGARFSIRFREESALS